MMCNCKDCKIVCDGKEVAVIEFTEGGISIKCTEACKEMFHKHHEHKEGECCK